MQEGGGAGRECPEFLAAGLALPFLGSLSATERKRERKRKRGVAGRWGEAWAGSGAGGGRGGGRRVGWGVDSLVGHLHHLLDDGVASRQEVLRVLLHFDGLEPLRHRAEGHPLGAAGAGQPDRHPAMGVTHLPVSGCSSQPAPGPQACRSLTWAIHPTALYLSFLLWATEKPSRVGFRETGWCVRSTRCLQLLLPPPPPPLATPPAITTK